MITVQLEKFRDNLDNLKGMFPLHYKQLAMDQDKVPLLPAYDIYLQQEDAGNLITMTVRRDGIFVGYFIGFITTELHYQSCLSCKMDIFFIHPDARGDGMPGLRLFRAVEKELRRRGVQRWFVGSKIKADAGALFKRMGFEPIEVYHSKWIGD